MVDVDVVVFEWVSGSKKPNLLMRMLREKLFEVVWFQSPTIIIFCVLGCTAIHAARSCSIFSFSWFACAPAEPLRSSVFGA